MTTTRNRYEMRADVDMDVVHVGISHGAAIAMVVDEPLDDFALAAACVEVDRIAGGVPRWTA
jgi:hypothetical protein